MADVLAHVPGAPDPLVRQALCRSAREFLRRTRAWCEWLEPAATVAQGEYDFDLPPQADLVRIERATLDGAPLAVQSYRQVPRDWTRGDGADQSLVSADMVTFRLTGLVTPGQRVQVQAALMPSATAAGVPDHLADRYLEPIAEGAKAQLMLTPNTSFYSADLAAVARMQFEAAVATHAVDVFRGHTNLTPRRRPLWC